MIAHRLKQIIGDRSQREFAKGIGISPSTLWEYMKGRTPSADFIARVCERENISMEWLIRGEGQPRPEAGAPAVEAGHLKTAEEMTRFEVSVKGYIAAHNRLVIEKMIRQLTSIINEGDYRKTGALQSLLDVLAPQTQGKETE